MESESYQLQSKSLENWQYMHMTGDEQKLDETNTGDSNCSILRYKQYE